MCWPDACRECYVCYICHARHPSRVGKEGEGRGEPENQEYAGPRGAHIENGAGEEPDRAVLSEPSMKGGHTRADKSRHIHENDGYGDLSRAFKASHLEQEDNRKALLPPLYE